VLLSGGASSLLELPRPGVSLAALREATAALQRAGADVSDLNTVRRALSRLKGGGLARLAAPARVVTLALSDVLGDRPEAIGSGPTVASPTSARDARAVLERAGLARDLPEVAAALAAAQERAPAPPAPEGVFRVVASNRDAVAAVARAARERGFRAQEMTTFLQGEAREAGRLVGGCAASVRAHGVPLSPPACLVFGGETTVTVRGRGRGGRNLELALGAALALAGVPRAAVLAFATDGVDGASDAAGAFATGETLERAEALGLSPHRALADNDADPFFRALGDLWTGGPTGTNVNDLAVALVYP
jgi:hydroxypyruvate reductase